MAAGGVMDPREYLPGAAPVPVPQPEAQSGEERNHERDEQGSIISFPMPERYWKFILA